MPSRVLEIVEDLIMRPADEREEALDRACAGDADLRGRVEGLLRAHDRAGGFMGTPTFGAPGVIAAGQESPGSIIGRYRLTELIGEGGFGRVFQAEQREPVSRTVAVKILKPGLDTSQVVARFEAERQALALMDHPGIATVLDGGATESGRPYFVMELVRGEPITDYCDRRTLPIEARLALMREVCAAVHHAHQKGVIHRDLKPGNILVAERDGAPCPKVIDFGIAKAASGRLTERTLVTGLRQMIGTPAYMSPEQTLGTGLDVDTRADIYSLGVILYELLTGTTPLAPDLLRSADLVEVQRAIREAPTPRPSTRVSTARSLAEVAAQRRTDPARLAPTLRGDLDWIVLKAVDKDRDRRYESASAFAEDLARYLSHEPVSARPPSTAYRVRKFVRRHRGPVLAGGLLAAVLVLGVIGTTAGLVGAVTQRQRAEHELARANEARRFITSMLEAIEPGVAMGQDTVLLRRVLDDAARRLESGEVSEPLIEAELRHTIASAYRAIGEGALAEPMARRAATLRGAGLGEGHPDALRSRELLGLTMLDLGRLSEAESVLLGTLDGFRRAPESNSRDLLNTLNSLGVTLERQGRFADAEGRFREALQGLEALAGPEDRSTLTARFNLGYALFSLGRLDEAEPHLHGAVEARRRSLGDLHPDTLGAMSAWAGLLQARGRAPEAAAVLEEALHGHRRVFGADHPHTLAVVNNMGGLLLETGRFAEAEPYLREAMEAHRRTLGEGHTATLNAIANMAGALQMLGRFEEADAHHREAIEGMRRSPEMGSAHPRTLSALVAHANLLRDVGKLEPAEALAREALDGFVGALGPEHPRTLNAAHALGATLRAMGRLEEAIEHLGSAWRGRRHSLGAHHPRTVQSAVAYGLALSELGRFAEAEGVLLPAAEAGGPPPVAGPLVHALVGVYEAWHRADPSGGHDARAARWRVSAPGPGGGG